MMIFEKPKYPKMEVDKSIEKGIRCSCGKYWGMNNFNKKCKRCKSSVKARGLKQ